MDVAVLGHRGYLGAVAARYFAEQGANVLTTNLRYDGSDRLPKWANRADLVVNCILSDDMAVNAELPHRLHHLIQPSTDAWRERTPYGTSKRRGEVGIVSRCGLVRIEPLRFGYTNWYCNPLTPLEWAQWAWSVRDSRPRIHHLGRERLTRYAVAAHVAAVWGHEPPKPIEGPEERDRIVPDETRRPRLPVALREFRQWLLS